MCAGPHIVLVRSESDHRRLAELNVGWNIRRFDHEKVAGRTSILVGMSPRALADLRRLTHATEQPPSTR